MRTSKLHNLFGIVIATLCLSAIPHQSQASSKIKHNTAQSTKERLVLMPLRVPDEDKKLTGAMETALVKGLQQKYDVYSGEQVSQKAHEIFMKENRNTTHKECDETKCMQNIAMAFQAELIATANVTKQDGNYFLALSIQNIFDNKVVQSESQTCEKCTAVQVVDKLKELSGTVAPTVAATTTEQLQAKVNLSDPETALWQEAKKGNAEEDYQAYLNKYPKGKFALLAKTKLTRLKDEARAASAQQDQDAWNTVQQSNDQDVYAAYLVAFPKGQFAALAQGRIDKIKREAASAKATQRREEALAEAKQNREAGNGPSMIRIPGKNYEMGKCDVTQKEWRVVMGSNPSNFTSCGDNCPVEQVSWYDIQEFRQKLNAKTGKQYRLPTEEEWEYACYGGSQTEYCGGINLDSDAWYKDNSYNTTHPVSQKQANGYGLFDMNGNVWQWMQNGYSGGRALRGGSWGSFTGDLRAAFRNYGDPASRSNYVGFRLARTLP